jgi:lipid II:glycine glycyltransferase (peptidoglycan interpeptide bridge formation enzyme)
MIAAIFFMTKIKLITDVSQKTDWNNAANHPLQSWQWGEIREKTGNQIIRLALVNEKNKISQVFLFTIHPLPLGLTVINYAKGPFVPENILQFLKNHFAHKAIFVKMEPEEWLESAGQYKLPIAKNYWQEQGLNYSLSSSPVYAKHTFIIDLSLPIEKLLSLLKTKTRYNINLAKRKGVVVKDETKNPKAFEIFFELYQQTVKRQNYLGHSRQYHQTVYQEMKQAKIARILTAYYQGQPLSSYTLFFFKETAYYLYGGSGNKHKQVMASNLLMWEAILLAKKLGCRWFDLWGALGPNYSQKHPWAGFHRFKEGYGGVHRSYLPTIDVVFHPWQYRFFNWLWPVRLKALAWFRRFF